MKKSQEQIRLIDYTSWLNGLYIVNAVQTAFNPKKAKYPKTPMFQEEEKKSLSQEEQFLLWVDEFNKRYEDTHEGTG